MSRRPCRFVPSYSWLLALVLVLAACAPSPPAAPASREEAKPAGPSEWVVAIAEEAPTLDPAWDSTAGGRQTWFHLFDGLLSFEGQDLKMTPTLAESWDRIDDRTWTFKLRKGVRFHNGDELTASDVKHTFELYNLEKSRNRTYMAEIAQVEALDQYTVKFTTIGPSPALLGNLNQLPIMPRAAREKVGDDTFAKQPVGTGPYRAVEFARGQRLVLEANPNYWRGPVYPKKLTLRPIPDPSTRVAELKTGGVQIIAGPPPARFKELDGGDTRLVPLKAGRIIIYPFLAKEKPFDDVRVRRAINYAVDRDAIIKNVLEGYGEPLHGPFASPWLGYDPDLKPYPYDPARAKQLLAEAGYPNGFETTFNHSSGVFLKDREIAEVVASQLAQVGVKVQLVPVERAKILNEWHDGVFKGITSGGWGTSADPDPMIGRVFYKHKAHKPDEKLNGLIEQTRRTVDLDQRRKLLQEFGRYVHDQAYWLFIHAQDEFYATRKDMAWKAFPVGGSFSYVAYYQVPGS